MSSPVVPPKLSIIVPAFNAERYLDECIQSITCQSFRQIEIIIVDDGSTDRTSEIAQRCCAQDPRVVLVRQANRGPGGARNRGLQLARGEFIQFVDSDDFLLPGAVSACLGTVRDLSADLVTFSGEVVCDQGGLSPSSFRYGKSHSSGPLPGHVILSDLWKRGEYSCSPVLYVFARHLIDQVPLCFHENAYHEDEAFSAELFLRARSAVVLPSVFYRRRLRSGSIMTSPHGHRHAKGVASAVNKILELSRSMGFSRFRTRRALRGIALQVLKGARRNAKQLGGADQFRSAIKHGCSRRTIARLDMFMFLYVFHPRCFDVLHRLVEPFRGR